MATIISGSPSGWSRIALGQRFCIWWVVATTASGTERLASYCQVESLFYDRQLSRTARSWPSAGSISVSRHERKALRLRHGSDSGLTAEMFRGWFSGLSMLKLILFQPKPTTTHYYSTLKIQKCNTGNGTVYVIRPRTIVYIIWTIVTSASIFMQQISYYMAPRVHMPNTGTVVTYARGPHSWPCNN